MRTPKRFDDYEWSEDLGRKVIVYSIFTRMTNNITDKLKLLSSTIQRIGKQLENSDFDVKTMADRKIQNRSEQRVRSNNFIWNMQQLIDNDPSISICEISQYLECSKNIVRLCLKENIYHKFYKVWSGQLLTEKMIMKHLLKNRELYHKIKHPLKANMWFLFWREIVCQDQAELIDWKP